MKNIYKYLMLAMVAVFGLSLTSCNDDDVTLSRKVLASVNVLEFDGLPTESQLITITSDGDWYVEAPEWVNVSPAQGSVGQTEVSISLADNIRDGLLDNPRKVTILFKGRNLESIASVIVRQGGDKFRDPIDYTIDEMEAVEDETVVSLPNMIVTALTGTGFVATDGDQYAYIPNVKDTEVAVGDKVNIVGEKFSDSSNMSYVNGDRVSKVGTGTVPDKTPIDITETLDATNGTKYHLVTVSGNVDGSSVKVGDNVCKVYFVDPTDELSIDKFNGHKITVTGYYAGIANPVLNIIPTEIIDLGVNEIVYFVDDFEWMDPWCVLAGAKDYVEESDKIAAQSINISKEDENGKRLIDEFYDRGYDFVKATYEGKEDRPFETRIYMQRNYVKFSLTGIEAGVILPALKNVPDGEKLELVFDWSPMRQGSPGETGRNYDAINLVVIIDNGSGETQIPVPPHTLVMDGPHEWMHAVIDLSKFDIDANTKITLRSADDKWPHNKVNRWFFDNVKIRKKM